jgi:hypothetical protein
MKITVKINGTDENPWHKMNLKQNPFGQICKAEFDRAEQQLNSLDGDPVKSEEDIRNRLKGFDPTFVAGVIERWVPGERTEFIVDIPV